MQLTKVVDNDTPLVGSEIVFTITLENLSVEKAINIEVQDFFDDTTAVEIIEAIPSNGDFDGSIWSLIEILGGETETLELRVRVLKQGSFINTARLLTSLPIDETAENNLAEASFEAEGIDLEIDKQVSAASILLGSQFDFTITLTNLSQGQFDTIVVEDILSSPADFEIVSNETSVGTFNESTNEWELSNFGANQEAVLIISAIPSRIGNYSNTASITSSFPADGNPDNNESTVNFVITESDCIDPGTICNIFSPNGDGVNDELILVNHQNYPQSNLAIYDKYGNLVYQKQAYDSSWQGEGDSGDLPRGTYYYLLNLGDGTDVKKGWIQLLR